MRKICLLILIFFAVCPLVVAEQVNLYFFYGQGCPHCAKAEIFLENLQEEYPEVDVYEYEVYSNKENLNLFQQYSAMANTSIQGVPTTFVDRQAFIGFSEQIGSDIESKVQTCIQEGCSDFNGKEHNENITQLPEYDGSKGVVGWIVLSLMGAGIVALITRYFVGKRCKTWRH